MKQLITTSLTALIFTFLSACGSGDGTNADSTIPVISLNGDVTVAVELGDSYTDAGATAFDDDEGDVTARIVTTGVVDTATLGNYITTYNVTDSSGNAAIAKTRIVMVVSDLQNASEVLALEKVDGRDTARLVNGQVFILDSNEALVAFDKRFPISDETLIGAEYLTNSLQAKGQRVAARDPLPSSVNLADNQTSLKRQLGRGSCVSHAVVAGIEAAYKRELGLELDLSEQFANHIQKMVSIIDDDVTPEIRENQLGNWGGSGVRYMMNLFYRSYRLPAEELHPYIGTGDFENTWQPGDEPFLDFRNPGISQRAIDDINLSNKPVAYKINASDTITHVSLPDQALKGARYGVARYSLMSDTGRRNLELYKQLLADGYEIIVMVMLRSDPIAGNGIRDPDTSGAATGAHAVLIVGYSDEDQAFLVKNSWTSSIYEKWSYAWATAGLIREAAIITDVRRDYESPADDKMMHTFIGRWQLNHDGWRGILDINRLPGTYPGGVDGQVDRRIGVYFGPDGITRRVNGVIRGEELEFYIDWDNPDLNYEALQGLKFSAHFTQSQRLYMAGTMLDNRSGNTYGFYATKTDYLESTPGASTISTGSLIGTWGLWGSTETGFFGLHSLAIRSIDETTYDFTGEIDIGSYAEAPVSGNLDLANNQVSFSMDFDGYEYHRFQGYFHSREPGIIAGTATYKPLLGEEFSRGFVAARKANSRPDVSITSPADNTSYARIRQFVSFNANISDMDGDELSIIWRSNKDGVIGTTVSFSRNDLSYGYHSIEARVTDSTGEYRSAYVDDINISNDAPTVSIITPKGSEPFCAGESINFKAKVTDMNTEPGFTLPDSAVTWRVLGAADFATGKTVSSTFQTGIYTISVIATDEQGATDEARVKLVVNDCSTNSPPVVQITNPASDSSTYDDRYVYDGYDDNKGMWYADFTVAGSATDAEDGELTGSSLVWLTNRTDLQTAQLATGSTASVRLYSNTCSGSWHNLSLMATDSNGNARTALVRIFIWTLC